MKDDNTPSYSKIDKYALDEEWERITDDVETVTAKLAKMKQRAADAKAEFERVTAVQTLKARSEPDKFGLDKVTDASVEAAVVASEPYQEAQKALNKARFRVDQLQGDVDTLSTKKKALEDLVQLHFQSYFSGKPRDKRRPDEVRKTR